jgi:hypothetical protein
MDAKLLEDEANIPLEDLLPPEYRELLLAQSADEPPSKRKRTISRTLSADVYELEPMLKKTKDDDCKFVSYFCFSMDDYCIFVSQ